MPIKFIVQMFTRDRNNLKFFLTVKTIAYTPTPTPTDEKVVVNPHSQLTCCSLLLASDSWKYNESSILLIPRTVQETLHGTIML